MGRHANDHRGFTLIELLITIAIVVILALVVAPSFVRMVANMRLQGAGNELVSDLHHARTEAQARDLAVSLTTAPDGHGYSIVADPSNIAGRRYTVKEVQLSAGVTVTGGVTINFDPLRGLNPGLSQLDLVNGNGAKLQLSATDSGQVQLCTPDGSLSGFKVCAS
jgi:prepilin-type N-terminal cleavage/methylation domain-containing protein